MGARRTVNPPAKRGGGKRTVEMRAVMNGLMYVLSTGCQWRAIPKDLPPKSTVTAISIFGHTTERSIASIMSLREVSRSGRARGQPNSRGHRQSKREERRKRGHCIDPHGYDAGKKIKGKKRHILVDTIGLLLHALIHPADIQGSRWRHSRPAHDVRQIPFLQKLFADGGYQGPQFRDAQKKALPFVDTGDRQALGCGKGFEVLPRRWVVEETFSWLGRCRRLAKDFENLNRKALAFLHLASIRLMLRRLCNQA